MYFSRTQPLHRYTPALTSCVVALAASTHAAGDSLLDFNFTPGPELAAMQTGTLTQRATAAHVIDGFTAAADLWRGFLHDPITVNITLEYTAIQAKIGGNASPQFLGFDYVESLYPAMAADSLGPIDQIALENLPQPLATGVPFMTNDTSVVPSPRILDNDGSINNTSLRLTRAHSKALNLIPRHDTASDGVITNNSLIPFDFDRSDGLSDNQIDFLMHATHEIGHVMGFFSGVDIVDAIGGDGILPEGPSVDQHIDLDPQTVFTPLDLFRYTQDSLSQPNQPLGGLNDGAFGQPATGDQPFFSIDGGATALGTFSSGRFNGDGKQASHWEDDLHLGILNPSFAPGELLTISPLDIIGFDVIGWDTQPTPEPGSILLLLTATMTWTSCRRR